MDGGVSTLLETVEKAFSVKFRPGEFTDESTFEDLCDALRSRLSPATAHVCFTSIVFWRLRRACVGLFKNEKRSITPWTATDLIVPSSGRYRAWSRLAEVSGLRLPGLEYSSAMSSLIFVSTSIGVLVTGVMVIPKSWQSLTIGALLLVTCVFVTAFAAAGLFYLLRPLASCLPTNCANFGSLAKTVVGLNYGTLVQEFGPAREAEMMEALRHVLGDLIDFAPEALCGENPRLIDLAEANDGFRAWV
jgi:hypothetical protein